jgi:hypothetical protein
MTEKDVDQPFIFSGDRNAHLNVLQDANPLVALYVSRGLHDAHVRTAHALHAEWHWKEISQQRASQSDPARSAERTHYWLLLDRIDEKQAEIAEMEVARTAARDNLPKIKETLKLLNAELAELNAVFSAQYQAPAAAGSASPEPKATNEKKWTPEVMASLRAYREKHTMPETAAHFGISESRIRQLDPRKKPKEKGNSVFSRR